MQSADENLPGSASQQRRWVLFEHPGAWGRDILDGSTFGAEWSERMAQRLAAADARLLLIRRPGRSGQRLDSRRVYLVDTAIDEPQAVTLQLNDPAELLHVDLHTGANDLGVPIRRMAANAPVVLVCTHGKRDKCCAVRGRPIAAALTAEVSDELIAADPDAGVWECSHTGGHRFAPVMLVLPAGLMYGSRDIPDYADAVRAALKGHVHLGGFRGRSALPPAAQAAEVAVRERLCEESSGETADASSGETADAVKNAETQRVVRGSTPLDVLDARICTDADSEGTNEAEGAADGGAQNQPTGMQVQVRHRDGRCWQVRLHQIELPPRPASCGAAPKPARTWVIDSVHDHTADSSPHE